MVTIKDIGRAVGLSHATVSRALNDSPLVTETTKTIVREAAQAMGYSPDPAARSLRGSASNLVGFVLPDIRNNFYSRIAKSVAQLAADRNLQLVLSITDDDPAREERQLAEIARARPRAVIITPTAGLTRRSAEILAGLRTVQMVRRHARLAADLVVADDHGAVAAATRHLADAGCRRIAYVGGDARTLSTGTDRQAGYLAAMAERGLGAFIRCELGPPQPAFGRAATARLLDGPARPEGIVLGSSQFATGLLEAVRRAGLSVPEDLMFTGYDDPDWFAHWGRGITTAVLPSEEIARAVTAFAIGADHLAGAARVGQEDGGGRQIVFATSLALRGSAPGARAAATIGSSR